MDFFRKNTGWIALFLFFLFMVLIVSQGGEEKIQQNNSGSVFVVTGSETKEDDSLEKLVDKIESESPKTIQNDENLSKQDEKKGFFEKLFGPSDSKKSSSGSGKESKDEKIEKLPDNDMKQISENIPNSRVVMTSQGLTKNGNVKSHTDNFISYPGEKLQTKIGNTYELAVYSLKINNKNFTQTLGYIHSGERVTQLTQENEKGCFLAQVEKNNIQGYVCKKWFREVKNDVISPEKIVQEHKILLQTLSNGKEIGSLHVITTVLSGGEIPVEKNDILDQLTSLDEENCFTGLVRDSQFSDSYGKVGKFCVQ